MNALGATLTALFSLITLCGSRRIAILGVMMGMCYVTQGQQINVGGFHFTAIRIVLLIGFVRTLARGEFQRLHLGSMDWALIGLTIVSTVIPGIRIGLWQEPIGNAYNVFLSYFVFRALVTDWQDVETLTGDLAVLIVPLALCMMLESTSGVNVFNIMGGLEADGMRAGRLRCTGAFRGPHTAGTFGASLVPLFVGIFFKGRRGIAVLGLIAATIITYTSNASGPLMAYLSSLVGLAFWMQRENMKWVKRWLLIILVLLGLTMKAPIWYLMAKISDLTGGDGWYRSYLMDQCWKHMPRWWLMGTNDTSDWGVTTMSWGGADLCNLYVSYAANAGLAGLTLFVTLLVLGFQRLGKWLRAARESQPESEIILWCLGSCLFSHVMTLFSVTYWDQMHVAWWGMLAIISSVTSHSLASNPAPDLMETSNEEASEATMRQAGMAPPA